MKRARIFAYSVTLFMAVLAASPLAAATETVNGIEWTYTVSDGKASVGSGNYYGDRAVPTWTTGAITIPSTLGGYHVTSIRNYAFYNCSSLTSVTIGNSVTSIGSCAFSGCSGLTSVTIPDSVTSIGFDAFYGCNHLYDTTTIPGIKLVDGWAVGNTGSISGSLDLTGIRGIGSNAFSDCSGLTSVTIPDSVTSIGNFAFSGCSGLTNISVSIGNPAYKSVDGLLLSKDGSTLIHGINGNVTIPDSVTSIGDGAFSGCSGLTSVTIPDSVTSIGSSAFRNCSGLSSVTIGNGVTSIGSDAFNGCSGLTSVTMPDSVTSIGDYAFSSCSGLTSVTIGNSVTSIGNSTFSGCSSLTSMTIGNSVTSIGNSAFSGCSSLTSVTIPDSVTNIGSSAFYGCSGLTNISVSIGNPAYKSVDGLLLSKDGSTLIHGINGNVTIPDSVTSIGDYAFYNCSGLTSVTIPDSVTSIGSSVFYGCSGLTSVTIPDSVTSIGYRAFSGCSSLTSVTIPDSVTSIGSSAFYNCSRLTSVTIGDSVTSIGYSAFYNCSRLTSVTIGDSVTSIGYSAFSGCSGLTRVTIPDSVTSIGGSAFYGCSGLTSVTINQAVCNSSLSEIFPSAYQAITNVVVLDSVTDISSLTFNDCNELIFDTVTIPGVKLVDGWIVGNDGSLVGELDLTGIRGIGGLAFSGCGGLTSVTIPDSVTRIWSYAFSGCEDLTSVTIPDSVTSIGDYAFQGCSGLTSVTIGNSVTSIGDSAFRGCSGLTSVTIPDSVTSIGDYAFFRCRGLRSVTISSSVTSIGSWAFSGVDSSTCVAVHIKDIAAWCAIARKDPVFDGGHWIDLINRIYHHSYALYIDGVPTGRLTIPESVTSIGDYAFSGCGDLWNVTIPNSVTNIGDRAFSSCHDLRNVTMSDSVTSIGEYAFSGCYGLTSVTIPDSVTSIGWYAFYACRGLTSATIGNSVTNITFGAFEYCDRLISVTIPDSVMRIEQRAFYECLGLMSVTIGNGVTSIDERAFYGCLGLRSVTIGNGVTSIGSNAFEDCRSLTSVYIKDIGAWCKIAFSGSLSNPLRYAHNLYLNGELVTDFTIPDSVTRIGSCAFQDCSGLTCVTIPDSVTSIGDVAFSGCSGLTSITIPDSVTSIGNFAFYNCSKLWLAIVPEDLDVSGAFYGNSDTIIVRYSGSMPDVNDFVAMFVAYDANGGVVDVQSKRVIAGRAVGALATPTREGHLFAGWFTEKEGGVQVDKDSVFDGDVTVYAHWGDPIMRYAIDNGEVTITGANPPSGNIIIPSQIEGLPVRKIGANAFLECVGLRSITVPDSVKFIGESAFEDCSGLESVDLGDGVEYIDEYPFYDCTNLKRVRVGRNVRHIDNEAFCGCDKLEEVQIDDLAAWCRIFFYEPEPDEEAPDHNYALSNPLRLAHRLYLNGELVEDLTIPDGVTSIGQYAFSGGSCLKRVTIPAFVEQIGEGAFYGCDNLEEVVFEGAAPEGLASSFLLENAAKVRYGKAFAESFAGLVDPAKVVGFEIEGSGAATGWAFLSGGDAEWSMDADGVFTSGRIGDGGNTWMEVALPGDGVVSFEWCASSECYLDELYDYASFLVDGVTNAVLGGAAAWTPVELDFSDGRAHTLRWVYCKDAEDDPELEKGEDCAWVRSFNFVRRATVSFDLGGGVGTMPESVHDLAGRVFALPTAEGFAREDHVFGGWGDGTTVYAAGADYAVPDGDAILTAVWTRKTFVSFDLGGGAGETPPTVKELGATVVQLPTAEGFVREDHVFAGWSDGAAVYAAGADYAVPDGDVTLTAVWTRKTFVSFAAGGEGVEGAMPAVAKVLAGETVVLPSGEGLHRANYTFAGWSDGAAVYAAGADYVVPDGDISLAAVWTANTLSVPVIASADVADGGTIETAGATISISAEDGASIYYTLDGTLPTVGNGTLYEGPFVATAMAATIKAVAVRDDFFDSEAATFSFARKPWSLAECLGTAALTASSGGDLPWTRVLDGAAHDGVAALRSGAVGEGQASVLTVTVAGEGVLSFWWKVSSERTVKGKRHDGCAFVVDGAEQAYLDNTTNEWTKVSVPISGSGAHTLVWTYAKDANGTTAGEDCAWLDEVVWTPKSAVPTVEIDGEKMEAAVVDEESGKRTIAAKEGQTLTEEDVASVTISSPLDSSDITEAYVKTLVDNQIIVELATPAVESVEEEDKDENDPSGMLANVEPEQIEEKPEPKEGEEVGALPVKTYPGLYYQASWGDDLGDMTTGEKVQATGEKLYLGVIKQTGDKGFYKISVSEE